MTETFDGDDGWPWPDALDACIAAPDSHRVIFENDNTRVLEVSIHPGVREPLHTHRSSSLMIVDRPARIRYYTRAVLSFETPPNAPSERRISWPEPEPPHSVENIDVQPYHAYRIEFRTNVTIGSPGRFSA
jgi:hypothetical protein